MPVSEFTPHIFAVLSYYGNDTTWRMALDLNRALLYGNFDGTWREAGVPNNYLAILDGAISGEGNGPLCPSPVESGILVGGSNPAAVDATACRLMRFDHTPLPLVANEFGQHVRPICSGQLDEIRVVDDRVEKPIALADVEPAGFKPQQLGRAMRQERDKHVRL